jgi:hypothetical protein
MAPEPAVVVTADAVQAVGMPPVVVTFGAETEIAPLWFPDGATVAPPPRSFVPSGQVAVLSGVIVPATALLAF